MKKLLILLSVALVFFFTSCDKTKYEVEKAVQQNEKLFEIGAYKAYIEGLDSIYNLYPEYIDKEVLEHKKKTGLAEYHLKVAKKFYESGLYEDADESYTKAIEIYPMYRPAVLWYNSVEWP